MSTPLLATNDLKFAALADAVAGTLAGAEVALFKNDIAVTSGTPLSSYTPADYDGYAPEAVTWLAPSEGSDGEPEVVGIVGEFRPTGSVVTNDVFGALLTDGAGTTLFAAARVETPPAVMAGVTDSLVVTVSVRYGTQGVLFSIH